MIGVDKKSAIHPRRRIPTSATNTPTTTTTASNPTRATYRGEPVEARRATPTANNGAMVESAPIDSCGLEPSSANTTVPATKA